MPPGEGGEGGLIGVGGEGTGDGTGDGTGGGAGVRVNLIRPIVDTEMIKMMKNSVNIIAIMYFVFILID
jgi:hypothetical protein